MEITLQYFDGCPNWEILDRRLVELLDGRSDVRVTRQLVESVEDAERLGFHGSPTVLVDGVDPFSDEHAPVGLACRVFRTPAGLAESPTVEQLREALSGPGSDGWCSIRREWNGEPGNRTIRRRRDATMKRRTPL